MPDAIRCCHCDDVIRGRVKYTLMRPVGSIQLRYSAHCRPCWDHGTHQECIECNKRLQFYDVDLRMENRSAFNPHSLICKHCEQTHFYCRMCGHAFPLVMSHAGYVGSVRTCRDCMVKYFSCDVCQAIHPIRGKSLIQYASILSPEHVCSNCYGIFTSSWNCDLSHRNGIRFATPSISCRSYYSDSRTPLRYRIDAWVTERFRMAGRVDAEQPATQENVEAWQRILDEDSEIVGSDESIESVEPEEDNIIYNPDVVRSDMLDMFKICKQNIST